MATDREIADELERIMERHCPSNTELGRQIRALYMENHTLALLLRESAKTKITGNSPFKKPVLRVVK